MAAAVRPDENRVMTQRELEDLLPDECFRLLATARVGRLVYQDDLGPLAVPVNYAMQGHDIIFRVEGGAKRTAMQQPMLAFEVDHINEEQHSGWSVLVRGVGAEVSLQRLSCAAGSASRRRGQPASTMYGFRLCRTPSLGGGSVRRGRRGDSPHAQQGRFRSRANRNRNAGKQVPGGGYGGTGECLPGHGILSRLAKLCRAHISWHCQVKRSGRGRQSHQSHPSHVTWGVTRGHRLQSRSDRLSR